MTTIANRLIVLAAGALAFGSVAFGETRLVAEIPFAFHTVNGDLPAGTYEIRETQVGGSAHVLFLSNTATQKSAVAGNPIYNAWRKIVGRPVVEFACSGRDCSLKAVRTSASSLEFAAPKPKGGEKMAVVLIAMRPANAD